MKGRSGVSSIAAGSCSVRKSRPSNAEFAEACGARHAVGVGTGTDAHRAGPARTRHRPRRRGHHGAADRRVHGPRDPDGRRHAGLRRRRPRSAARSSREPSRRRSRRARARSCPCTSTARPPTWPPSRRSPAATASRSSKTARRPTWRPQRAGRSARSARPARSASIRPRTSARLGDGGAIVTNDAALARRAAAGCATAGRPNVISTIEFGVNSRLDEMQAAILRARLPFLPAWTARRRRLAARYRAGAGCRAGRRCPRARSGPRLSPVHRPRRAARDALQAHLRRPASARSSTTRVAVTAPAGVRGPRETACPNAERLASTVLSLPLNPGLSDAAVDAVAGAVANALPAGASQPR